MLQTFTWTGAAYQDWFTPSDWSPSGPPTAGSVALITSSAGPQLNAADTVDNVGIVLDGSGAKLVLNGGTLGAGAAVTQAASYYCRLQVLAASEFDGSFGFAPGIHGAQLDIYGTATATLTIGQSGTLTAATSNGIILERRHNHQQRYAERGRRAGQPLFRFAGWHRHHQHQQRRLLLHQQERRCRQTISFADQTGLLDIYNDATVAGPITNFQPGDAIGLGGVMADDVSYNATTHTLAVTNQGTTVASFNLFTNGSSIDFSATRRLYGDTVITSSDATRIWNGGTADWYDAANWTSTPSSPASFPLAGDTVISTAASPRSPPRTC